MGAKIYYTHDRDLMRKSALLIGGLLVTSIGGAILDPIARPIEKALESNHLGLLWLIIMWGYIIVSYYFSVLFIDKYLFPQWKATAKYLATFNVDLKRDEAEKINFLINGSLGGKWYPLDWLLDIEPRRRKKTLFEFANNIAEKHNIRPPFKITVITKRSITSCPSRD